MESTMKIKEVHNIWKGFIDSVRDISSLSESENKQDVSGSLGISVKLIPGFEVSGEGDLDLTDEEKKFTESLNVEFYGDYDVSPPTR